MSRFGDWLEGEMDKLGGRRYTFAQLARDLNISQNTASSWRNGKGEPDDCSIYRLAIHFGTTAGQIYDLLDRPRPAGLRETQDAIFGIVYRMTDSEQDRLLKHLGGSRLADGKAGASHPSKVRGADSPDVTPQTGDSDVEIGQKDAILGYASKENTADPSLDLIRDLWETLDDNSRAEIDRIIQRAQRRSKGTRSRVVSPKRK